MAVIGIVAYYFLKAGTPESTLKISEKQYWKFKRQFPGLDEHQYLAMVYKQRMKARAMLYRQSAGLGEELLDIPALAGTYIFSVLPSPESIRALSLHILFQENQKAGGIPISEEYEQLVGPIIYMLNDKPEQFIELYRKRNPNMSSVFDIEEQIQSSRRLDDKENKENEKTDLEKNNEITIKDKVKNFFRELQVEMPDGRTLSLIESREQDVLLNPDNAEAHFRLGFMYLCMGDIEDNYEDYEKAIEAFKKTIRLKPDYVDAYMNLGLTYEKIGRFTEAIETYKQAIKLSPDNAEAHLKLGLIYLTYPGRGSAWKEYEILEKLDQSKATTLHLEMVSQILKKYRNSTKE